MKLFNSEIGLRIIALWAFSEAFLGGILHGFKIPFAGLALSLVAAGCMSLLAVYDDKRGAILKATLVVIAVKFILSPHTPPMAYVAVLIEGLAGELFFLNRRFLRLPSFFLTVFCLLYSAFQHLLILTIVFGKGFWMALDTFLNGITKSFIKQPQHYSLYLVVFYISCYLVAGIFGGLLNIRIISNIQSGKKPPVIDELQRQYPEGLNSVATNSIPVTRKSGFRIKYLIAIVLLIALALSYTPVLGETVLKSKLIQIIVRGILIIIAWNFLLSPLLIKLVSGWVKKFKISRSVMLQEVLSVLPDIKKIVQVSWQMSNKRNKLKQFSVFFSNTMNLIVYGR